MCHTLFLVRGGGLGTRLRLTVIILWGDRYILPMHNVPRDIHKKILRRPLINYHHFCVHLWDPPKTPDLHQIKVVDEPKFTSHCDQWRTQGGGPFVSSGVGTSGA